MERWSSGDKYEPYVGRWSREVAREFLGWLGQPPGLRWLDVGSGTGALTQTILTTAEPAAVVGIDRSAEYAEYARRTTTDERARFVVGDAEQLPDEQFDVVVSGLVLNFVPDQARAVRRMREIGGTVAAYVWDYAEGMQLMKYFWDIAGELDPEHRDLHEGSRFPVCRPDALEELFAGAGLGEVKSREIVVATTFKDFDDYWSPFLGGQGAAPAYVSTMSEELRDAVRDTLRDRLPVEPDGSIRLTARAWAVRGTG